MNKQKQSKPTIYSPLTTKINQLVEKETTNFSQEECFDYKRLKCKQAMKQFYKTQSIDSNALVVRLHEIDHDIRAAKSSATSYFITVIFFYIGFMLDIIAGQFSGVPASPLFQEAALTFFLVASAFIWIKLIKDENKLSTTEAMHLEAYEKKLIEKILADRLERANAADKIFTSDAPLNPSQQSAP